MKKTCPTCGNMVEAKIRYEYESGEYVKQIVFVCPCGYLGVGRPRD